MIFLQKFIDNEKMRQISMNSHKSVILELPECKRFYLEEYSLVTPVGMLDFSKGNWLSLQKLILVNQSKHLAMKLANKGCKILSKVQLHNIQYICLGGNLISSIGIEHFSKAAWTTLRIISLSNNQIEVNSMQKMIKANWNNLTSATLINNPLSAIELKNLFLSTAKQLSILLQHNSYGYEKEMLRTPIKNKRYLFYFDQN